MPTMLEIKHSEASVQLVFAEPRVDLFEPFPSFLGDVLASLGPHGLRLSDAKFENQGANLGDLHLRCQLHGGASQVRFFLDKLEVATQLRLPIKAIRDLTSEAFEAVRSRREIRVQTAVTTLAFHAATDNPVDLIRSLGGATPSGLGPVVGSGAHFYFGAEGSRLAALLDCDLSQVVAGGLFLRLHLVHDVQNSDLTQVVSDLEVGLGSALAAFDLACEEIS